jgi:hypothetical protein
MPITLNNTTITGLGTGGLPANVITGSTVYSGAPLQVVQTVKKDVFSGGGVAATWYPITGFTATITPSSATNKILVMADMQLGTGYWTIRGILTRNSANVTGSFGTARSNRQAVTFCVNWYEGGVSGYQMIRQAVDYLDSPASTSAQTYGISLSGYNVYGVYMNRSGIDTDASDYYGCPASSLTLIEVKA